MKKTKRPAPSAPADAAAEHEEVITQHLVEHALELSVLNERVAMADEWKKKASDFQKTIKKCLQQKKDDVLHDALERTQYEDIDAYRFLRERIEDACENIVFRRSEGPDLEVNAFVIPLFAHTDGGLRAEQCFQDEQAFELLRKSIHDAQLESADARVVLVSHAYHPDEIDRIGYSQLSEMVHEAFESMTRKKMTEAPAIARSMSGWPDNRFAPDDRAVELRFLLGFALKATDDPFYRVPQNEAAADRYFDTRAARFQQWTRQFAPLVKRCLVTDGRDIEIDFLYQDLFFGGKEAGFAEYQMLQLMSELHHALDEHAASPQNTRAIVGPADVGGEIVLRVNLYADAGDALLASSDKPVSAGRELRAELDDVYDALATIGVKSLAVAASFDAEGNAVDARPYNG